VERGGERKDFTGTAVLNIEDVTKVYNQGTINEVVALQSLSVQVDKGDFVTVIGSNGAGKSTMLNVVAGSDMPDTGRVMLGEQNVTAWPEHRRASRIGRVFQNPLLGTCASMSIEENFSMALRRGMAPGLRWGVTRRQRDGFREQLSQLGLGLERRLKDRVGLLSGGQRQSLTLLMATFRRPELLLLDEHTAALDPRTAEQILELTRRLIREMELTAVMVTHNMGHALELGNRLLMMDRGGVVLDVRGEEKERTTVGDLLDRFARVKGQELQNDKMLLA
jgi:putative ABC transport system ATP-binding protein